MKKKLAKIYMPVLAFYNRISAVLFRQLNSKEKDKIRQLKNLHQNQRCFVIGNGPSLTAEDLDLIAGEISFSCNMIFDLIKKTKWKPYYYFCHDPGYVKKIPGEIDSLKAHKKFIGYYYDTASYVNKIYRDKIADIVYYVDKKNDNYQHVDFSFDVSDKSYASGSVSYAILQFAVYMGFSEIYLIGFDHNLNSKTEKTHFEGYSGNKVSDANMDGLTKGFIRAKEVADAKGIKIVNCTRGGKLEVFERKSLEEIL